MNGIKTTIIIGCAAVWLFPLSGAQSDSANETQTESPKHIAVNPLQGHGITDDETAVLSDVLRNELLKTGKFKVMERAEMDDILKEQGFQQTGACTEDACLVQMGQMLGIEQMVAGSVGKVGKAFSITLRLISIQTGEIVRSVAHTYTGPIESLLTSEMSVVAKKLAGEKTVFKEKVDKRNPKIFIVGTAITLGVVGASVGAVYFIRRRRGPGETAELEIRWTEN
jgi:TolB-like protein